MFYFPVLSGLESMEISSQYIFRQRHHHIHSPSHVSLQPGSLEFGFHNFICFSYLQLMTSFVFLIPSSLSDPGKLPPPIP